MKHHILSTLCLATALSLTACRKAPEPAATVAEPAERPASVSIEQAEAPAPGAVQPESSARDAGSEASALPAAPRDALDLESLNTILETYATAYDRVPKSIDEMVRLKLIPRTPKASPGKRYVIDTVRRQIREEKL